MASAKYILYQGFPYVNITSYPILVETLAS